MARSRRKKTTRDRLIEAALYAAPAPVRTIASNPIGFRFLLIAGAVLMATGIMTLDWQDGMPHFKFHREKASQVKEGIVNDLGNKVQGWNLPSPQGNGNPPGYFTQTTASPYQQPAQQQYGQSAQQQYGQPAQQQYGQPAQQQYGAGYPANPIGWGQNPGQPAGYYYPNQTYPNQTYPNPTYPNQPFQNPAVPNGPYPQWPNQQGSYPQTGSGYPGNDRR